MALAAVLAAALTFVANGVQLTTPSGWHRVTPWGAGPATDPRTLLVVGTARTRRIVSACEITSYRPASRGAVVVAVGWKKGGTPRERRLDAAPLRALTKVRRHLFECWPGRGAAAQVTLGGRVYQVNVLVGDRAGPRVVAQALAVGRSFDRSR